MCVRSRIDVGIEGLDGGSGVGESIPRVLRVVVVPQGRHCVAHVSQYTKKMYWILRRWSRYYTQYRLGMLARLGLLDTIYKIL